MVDSFGFRGEHDILNHSVRGVAWCHFNSLSYQMVIGPIQYSKEIPIINMRRPQSRLIIMM